MNVAAIKAWRPPTALFWFDDSEITQLYNTIIALQ